MVKSVNRELLAWDHVIMAFDWQGVKTINVGSSYLDGVTQLESLKGMSVTADQATLVGEYKYSKDSDTDYGYMITNFTDPSADLTDSVTVTVKSGQSVLVYRDGVGNYVTADAEGKLEFTLEAGEAVFLITD